MTSRTPVNGVGYDKSLLADAPEITKADKQEGYNPDLLEQGKSSGRPSPRPGTVPPAAVPAGAKYTNGSDSSHGRGKHIATAATAPPAKKQRSNKLWWIVAGIVFLLIVAIAVGVGVGVGTKKKSSNTINDGASNGSNSSGNGGKTSTDSTGDGGKTSTDSTGATQMIPATPDPTSPPSNGGAGGTGGDGDTTTSK